MLFSGFFPHLEHGAQGKAHAKMSLSVKVEMFMWNYSTYLVIQNKIAKLPEKVNNAIFAASITIWHQI